MRFCKAIAETSNLFKLSKLVTNKRERSSDWHYIYKTGFKIARPKIRQMSLRVLGFCSIISCDTQQINNSIPVVLFKTNKSSESRKHI